MKYLNSESSRIRSQRDITLTPYILLSSEGYPSFLFQISEGYPSLDKGSVTKEKRVMQIMNIKETYDDLRLH